MSVGEDNAEAFVKATGGSSEEVEIDTTERKSSHEIGAILTEVLLTAHIYSVSNLGVDSFPSPMRQKLWSDEEKGIPKPLMLTVKTASTLIGCPEEEVKREALKLPFVDFNEFGAQLTLTVPNLALEWLLKYDGVKRLSSNPILAYWCEKNKKFQFDSNLPTYKEAMKSNIPLHAERFWINQLITDLREELGDEAEEMLKLFRITTPAEVIYGIDDLVLSDEQRDGITKLMIAIENRDYLKEVGLYDIGKVLFVGPPGTGKTSIARVLSSELHLPLLEVRLSMVTNQYLGETSKNIDRMFELATRISPCILFIDEFDFVARTRTSDEHAAVKRAVNALLKAIDEVSLVNDGVLLIAATNHPQVLDRAALRRFDDILWFPLPTPQMRGAILSLVCKRLGEDISFEGVVEATEGFSGSDLRAVVKEAVLSTLKENRRTL
ncbi:MAG: ATP-binding protein, partial [Methermicoccaceae archaeon]